MALLSVGAFTSKLFTFIVGEDRKAITVHAEIISQQSTTLDRLINGPMLEAKNGAAILDDVLEDTFIRFCQFAYMGDYETPTFVGQPKRRSLDTGSPHSPLAAPIVQAEEQHTQQATVASDIEYWFSLSKGMKSKSPKKTSKLRESFHVKVYDIQPVKAIRSKLEACCGIRKNEVDEEDYTPVFLGHARLYVFAERYGIGALKALTLNKLHQTLNEFTLYDSRHGDILELVSFAYSNDNTPDLENGLDDLRALVTEYVMCELNSLVKAPEFFSLQDQFTRDLLLMMRRRLK